MTATPDAKAALARPRLTLPVDRLVALATLVVIALALASAVVLTVTMGLAGERNYNEGWNVVHALRVAAGEPLYAGNPMLPVNYPYLSFYLVAALKPLFGDVLMIGRVVNYLAFLATVAGCFVIVRRLGGRPVDGALAAACAGGFQIIQAAAWIGVDDPQMLGEALMIAGLACYLRDRSSLGRLAATALLLGLGGFTKHNLIAIPAAITLDILVNDRRRFAAWCGLSAAVVGILAGLGWAAAGHDFFKELLAPRIVSLSYLPYHLRKFAITFKIPMLIGAVFLVRALPPGQAVLLRAYLVAALASALFFGAGEGTSYNIYLDVVICLSITGGLTLQRWQAWLAGSSSRGAVAALAAVAAPLLIGQPMITRLPQTVGRLVNLRQTLAPLIADAALFDETAAALRRQGDPALCESLLLCVAAGKPVLIDPFNARQAMLTGRLDERLLLDAIAARKFAVVALPARIYDASGALEPVLVSTRRFTETTLRAIAAHYHVEGGVLSFFYVPNPD